MWKIQEKNLVGRVKEKDLIRIQRDLLKSKDLGEKTRLHLGGPRVAFLLG
jgi:hypothetical protein